MSIDITYTAPHDGAEACTLVASAVQELTNRHDFRTGAIKPGRVVDIARDFNAERVTIDLNILNLSE